MKTFRMNLLPENQWAPLFGMKSLFDRSVEAMLVAIYVALLDPYKNLGISDPIVTWNENFFTITVSEIL